MFGFKSARKDDTEEATGLFASLRQRLSKTRENLSSGLADLLLGKKQIDDELLEQLEEQLLMADVGIQATQKITSRLTESLQRQQLGDNDSLIAALKSIMSEILQPCAIPLQVDSGKKPFVILMAGVNGAGKTTTIRSILGLTPPRRGAIWFDGIDATRLPTHEIARRGIGWVPDDRRIFPTLTVARNLQIAIKRSRFRAWSVEEMCEIFSALEHLMRRECENLSGGEMQMVAISRALLSAPGLVLFDEPSQGLAPKIVQDVMNTITRLKQEGISVLVVEQNALSVLQVCDRIYVMDTGRIVHHGPARDLLENDAERIRLLGI